MRVDPAADPIGQEKPAPGVREVSSPEDRAIGARVASSPQWQGAAVVEACAEPLIDGAGDQYTPQLAELALDLRAKFEKIQRGDLADVEAMLMGQASALQALFSYLTVAALNQRTVSLMQLQMSVALRAQAQSRATITALADIKRPRQPSFIAQQNLAVNQQVNNAVPRAVVESEIENRQIKLLEATDGERLDTGEKGAAGGADKTLETVGEIERAEDRGG